MITKRMDQLNMQHAILKAHRKGVPISVIAGNQRRSKQQIAKIIAKHANARPAWGLQ